jgi:hypothetical protein
MVLAELIRLHANRGAGPWATLEERETISSRSRPAARSVTPAPIIEDHAQRSRIPIATASSETEVAGEGLHGDRQAMVEEVLIFIERRGPPNWRRRAASEYALASFIKEMKKDG